MVLRTLCLCSFSSLFSFTAGAKILCEQNKLPNQVLLNVEALRDKSLHIRNIMKQVICKATGGDPDDNFGRCHSFVNP